MKKIYGILTAIIFFSAAAKAQIVYTDVKPDIKDSCSQINCIQMYYLDLNNDGINDFEISISTDGIVLPCGYKRSANIISLNSNKVIEDKLSANTVVDSLSSFDTGKYLLRSSSWIYGSRNHTCSLIFSGKWTHGDGYVGLKLKKGNHVYYGWLRLNISFTSLSANFTIKDYAYNLGANQPILTGQKTNFKWIDVTALSAPPYCAGSAIKVTYVKGGNFKTSNVFTAQLSDSTGSFLKPVIIGSKQSYNSGTIKAIIPATTSSGIQYRIRVVSSNPYTDSVYENKSGITIGMGIIKASGPTTFCEGNDVVLFARNGYTYQWLKNGKIIKGAIYQDFVATASGNYECVINGVCGTDTSNTIVVTVNPLPAASIAASGPTTFCNGGSVTLSDTIDNQTWTYQWYGIEGATKSSYNAGTTGNYSLEVTTKKGCYARSNDITVIAAITPQGVIGRVGDTSFCIGDSTILVADNNNHVDNSFQYQWKKNGQNIAGATNEIYIVKTAGTYTCTMTNVCGSVTPTGVTLTTKQCLISSSVFNNDKIFSSATQLKIAPNPFSNSTIISFHLQQLQKISISIFNMNGRLIKTLTNAQMQSGTNQLTWNAKDKNGNTVGSGIYLLKMQAGNYTGTKKLVVVK